MKMWVRSQDKETLLKVDYLYIPISRDKEHFGIYTKNGVRDEYLGIYKTKERALEVLDEIQGRIVRNEALKTMLPSASTLKGYEEKFGELFKEMIYEMPED